MKKTVRGVLSSLMVGVLLAPSLATAQRVEFYHLDALGSVRAVTDENGDVVERHDYLPFGEEWNAEPSSQPRKFTGKQRDEETGWDYFGARYYGFRMGRFTTVDPYLDRHASVVDPQRWNRYAYARNNPLRYVDPDGRYEIDVHQYLTVALAEAAGIPPAVAAGIGAGDQGVDDNPATSPLQIFGGTQTRTDYHFTSDDRRQQLWNAALKSGSPEELGVFFHAQQDSFSHAGFGPRLGHLLAGHSPDKTYSDPAKADRMAHDTYSRLLRAARKLPGNHYTPLPWSAIRRNVQAFNRARTPEDKTRALQQVRGLALQNIERQRQESP